MESYNDDDSVEEAGTSKNVRDMQRPVGDCIAYPDLTKDVSLCVHNILVQRLLHGEEDLESLPHNPFTIRLALKLAEGKQLNRHATRIAKDIRNRAESMPKDLPFFGYRSAGRTFR